MKVNLSFKYRADLPTIPEQGCIYWIRKGNGVKDEIWFAPDTDKNNMVRLSNDDNEITPSYIEDLINRISDIESGVGDIQNTITELQGKLVGVDFDKFLTEDDLPSIPTKVSDIDNDLHYVTEDELRNYVPEIEIDGSDVDEIIEEKVTEKLTWNVIKT